MSETSIQEIRSLKVGRYIVIDGEPCKLVEYITSKPGKHGEAKARMVAIGLFDKQKRSLVHPVKHKVHVPPVDRRKAQILANMGSEIQMMDLEDYNTFNVPLSDIHKIRKSAQCLGPQFSGIYLHKLNKSGPSQG